MVETPINLNDDQKKLFEKIEMLNQKNQEKHSPRSQGWLDKVKEFFD